MAFFLHLATGFASKLFFPHINVFMLLLASELLDILVMITINYGLEYWPDSVPEGKCGWITHGATGALFWAILSSLILHFVFRKRFKKYCIPFAIVVFGHWIVDAISHPMGSVLPGHDLGVPLFIGCDWMIGLGLYNISAGITQTIEFVSLFVGMFLYFFAKNNYETRLKEN